jgi:medium-chain acyl-[acyl-carrier-protein] hydrolase
MQAGMTKVTNRLRLFCLPYAGGSAAHIYRGWQSQLPEIIEVIPIELAGRGQRFTEPPAGTPELMIADVLDQLLPLCLEPFALFGHSLGAILGFEAARILAHEHGHEPAHLLVSGCQPPRVPRRAEPSSHLPADQFRTRLRELDGTAGEVLDNAELLDLLLPMIQADFAVVEHWRYQASAPLSCPVTALGGLEDPVVASDSLDAWSCETTGQFQMALLPGGHFFIDKSPRLVLSLVAACLDGASTSGIPLTPSRAGSPSSRARWHPS